MNDPRRKSSLLASILFLCAVGAAQSQVARVVVNGPVQPGDTNTHVDLQVGGSATLTAIALNPNGVAVAGVPTWSSGNPSVASIGSKTGILKAKTRGYATITATIAGVKGTTRACVTIEPQEEVPHRVVSVRDVPVHAPWVFPVKFGLTVADTIQMLALTQLATTGPTAWGPCVHWTSDFTSHIDRNGLVTVAGGRFSAGAFVGPSVP